MTTEMVKVIPSSAEAATSSASSEISSVKAFSSVWPRSMMLSFTTLILSLASACDAKNSDNPSPRHFPRYQFNTEGGIGRCPKSSNPPDYRDFRVVGRFDCQIQLR